MKSHIKCLTAAVLIVSILIMATGCSSLVEEVKEGYNEVVGSDDNSSDSASPQDGETTENEEEANQDGFGTGINISDDERTENIFAAADFSEGRAWVNLGGVAAAPTCPTHA